jgi:hypothetical protein
VPSPGNGDYRGFLLSAGEFTTIEYPGANETNLWDVNDRGQIVGGFGTLDGKSHLFVLWKDGFTAIDLPGVVDINQVSGADLTTIDFPDALSTIAFGINARRDIVGWYWDAKGEAHGFC